MANQESQGPGKRPIQKIYARKKSTYVYGLIDPRDKSLFWVGMTSEPRLRYDQHAFDMVTNNRGKQKLIDEMKAAGCQPGMVLIEEFQTRKEAADLERSLISLLSGITGIKLTNIEHRPDKSWAFKTDLQAARRNQPWDADQRIVLIRQYRQGMICDLIARQLQRTPPSVKIELWRIEKAGFIKVRDEDRVAVDEAKKNSKYPVPDLHRDEIEKITGFLPKVGNRYGDLNAEHIRYGIINRKQEDKKSDGSKNKP